MSDGLSVPLQVQVLESEMLPYTKNETATSGNVIREGIEFDGIGRRVAYHFYRSHPGEAFPVVFDMSTTRVPASEILHLYKPLRPGQIRGQPQITPAMVRLYLLDLYDDAELDRKRVAAMFAGFVTKKTPASELSIITEGGLGPLSDDPGPGSALAPLEPGTLQVLEENEDITFSNPSEVGGSYEAFIWRNLLAICSGCGVPYAPVTSDTSKSNYSSSREAQVEFRRRIDQVQHLVLVFQMCRPIWQRWFSTAVLSGVLAIQPKAYLADPRAYDGAKWIPPKWEWVDPLKDRKAEQLALEMGVKSRDDVIEAEGEEPEVNDRRIQASRQRELDMDLGFRPVAIRESVNIAAEADDPDDAVRAATTGGEDDEPVAAPKPAAKRRRKT